MDAYLASDEVALDVLQYVLSIPLYVRGSQHLASLLAPPVSSIVPDHQVDAEIDLVFQPLTLNIEKLVECAIRVAEHHGWYAWVEFKVLVWEDLANPS